jgi:hypothetical protein
LLAIHPHSTFAGKTQVKSKFSQVAHLVMLDSNRHNNNCGVTGASRVQVEKRAQRRMRQVPDVGATFSPQPHRT